MSAGEEATWLTWAYACIVLAGLVLFGLMGILAALNNGEQPRWRR